MNTHRSHFLIIPIISPAQMYYSVLSTQIDIFKKMWCLQIEIMGNVLIIEARNIESHDNFSPQALPGNAIWRAPPVNLREISSIVLHRTLSLSPNKTAITAVFHKVSQFRIHVKLIWMACFSWGIHYNSNTGISTTNYFYWKFHVIECIIFRGCTKWFSM